MSYYLLIHTWISFCSDIRPVLSQHQGFEEHISQLKLYATISPNDSGASRMNENDALMVPRGDEANFWQKVEHVFCSAWLCSKYSRKKHNLTCCTTKLRYYFKLIYYIKLLHVVVHHNITHNQLIVWVQSSTVDFWIGNLKLDCDFHVAQKLGFPHFCFCSN